MAMSRYARFEHLRVDKPDAAGVVELVLDAPDLNAVEEGAHGDLAAVWREFDADPEVRAVLLRGEGQGFSAGGSFDLPQLRTPLCDLLGIDVPIMQAGMGNVAYDLPGAAEVLDRPVEETVEALRTVAAMVKFG